MGVVEFSNKLLGVLYITDGAPLVFFNTIALPVYDVLNLSVEYPAVKDLFDFILLDAIVNDWGWQWWVVFLTFSDRVTLEGM